MSSGGLEDFDPDRLRTLREEAGLTRAHIAVRCGVTSESARAWEVGLIVPAESKVPVLAAALGIHPSALTNTPRNQPTLRQLRQWRGLRCVDAAELAGIGVDLVYDSETYVSALKPRVCTALADAYEVSERTITAAWKRGRRQKFGEFENVT